MSDSLTLVQEISILLSTLVVIVILIHLKKKEWNTDCILWAIPILAWMLHAIIFNAYVITDRYLTGRDPSYAITLWSSILRLQAYLTILEVETTRLLRTLTRGNKA